VSVEADLPALNAARPLDRSIDVHLDSHWGLLMNTSVVALPRATGPRPAIRARSNAARHPPRPRPSPPGGGG